MPLNRNRTPQTANSSVIRGLPDSGCQVRVNAPPGRVW